MPWSINPCRRHASVSPSPRRAGFTLMELLTTIAIIALVISLMLPSLGQSRESAWRAHCASNQHQIHVAMKNANRMVNSFSRLPNVGSWISFVREHGAAEALVCPKGKHATDGDGIDEVYSVQVAGGKTTQAWVSDIKAGNLSGDNQLCRVWQGGYMGTFGESGKTWIEDVWGKPLASHEMGVGYDNDGGYVVQYGQMTTIYSLNGPGAPGIGSNHWVCKGIGGPDWRSEIIMQLTGGAYVNRVDPPVQIGASHYGMNTRVSDASHRGGQILLMDYSRTIIRMGNVGSFADDFDKQFAPRHFNQANVLFVDGHVELMARGKLNANEPIWYPE